MPMLEDEVYGVLKARISELDRVSAIQALLGILLILWKEPSCKASVFPKVINEAARLTKFNSERS